MAKLQVAPELNISPKLQDQSELLSLTMAALQLVNPWRMPPQIEEQPKERVISLKEVSHHDSPNDCWVIIYDRVYDITTFLDEHPGGAEVMLEYAGGDSSTAFRGSGHSQSAVRALNRFLIGELPMHERIYRRPGGLKLSDMPE